MSEKALAINASAMISAAAQRNPGYVLRFQGGQGTISHVETNHEYREIIVHMNRG